MYCFKEGMDKEWGRKKLGEKAVFFIDYKSYASPGEG
jgi:hypothetical protein